MKFSIAATTTFLPLLLLGHFSAPVSASGGFVMAETFDFSLKPNKIYHDATGEVAFTITAVRGSSTFQVINEINQDIVFRGDDGWITCSDPFTFPYPSAQLSFTSSKPPKAPSNMSPNPRTWKITYRGSVFYYVPSASGSSITGPDGTLDTSVTSSFNDNNPWWKTQVFGRAAVTINFTPAPNSRFPVKYTIALYALARQHAQKCEMYKSK